MFEISLTATQETADEVLQAFITSVPQFDVKETRNRGTGSYGKCYIYLQLTPNGSAQGRQTVKAICETDSRHQSAAARSGLQQVTARTRVRCDLRHNPENFQSRGLTSARKLQRKEEWQGGEPCHFFFSVRCCAAA